MIHILGVCRIPFQFAWHNLGRIFQTLWNVVSGIARETELHVFKI